MYYEEVSEDLTLKGLMIPFTYEFIRNELDEVYSDYDCKLIYEKLKRFILNRDVQYLMIQYDFTFSQAIDKMVDSRVLKLY